MKIRIHLLYVLLCLASACVGQANNIRFGMTAAGLKNLDGLIDEIAHFFIKAVKLPDFHKSTLDISTSFRNLTAHSINYDDIDVTIQPSKGFHIAVKGFQTKLNYTLDYKIDFPERNGTISSEASISQSDFSADISISEVNGIPQVKVTNAKLTLNNLQTGLPGWLGDLIDFLEPVLKYLIDYILPAEFVSQINDDIAAKIADFPFSQFLDPQNLTTMDIKFSNAPLFQTQQFVVNMYVDIHPTGKPGCGIQTHNIAFSNQGSIDLVVDEQLFQCALQGLINSGALENLIAGEIEKYLPLHDRMGLQVNFGKKNTFSIQGAFTANLDLAVTFLRSQDGKLTKMLTISDDQDLVLDLSLLENDGISLFAAIKDLTSAFGLVFLSPDMPEKYASQIKTTDWSELATEADNFLLKTVPLNFTYNIPNTFLLSAYLKDAELEPKNGYFVASLDVSETLPILDPQNF